MTGASGFLGKHLVPFLVQNGYAVRAATRFPDAVPQDPQVESVRVVDFTRAELDWAPLVEGIDSIVHLAGAAHTLVTDETYNTVNHLATRSLAITAAKTGVHFIQVSSIAAQSGPVSASILTEQDVPTPVNAYGISKLLAEIAVRDSGVPFTILRPVVVYGPGAKGNFETVEKIARLPLPLPVGALESRRSVLSIENFCSAVLTAKNVDEAVGETFIVSDPNPVTLAEIVQEIRRRSHRQSNVFSVRPFWLAWTLTAMGKADLWDRIGQSLVASPAKLMAVGWKPAPSKFAARPNTA